MKLDSEQRNGRSTSSVDKPVRMASFILLPLWEQELVP
eukprot:COSAG02_NODE_45753_length_354_cov_0.925490_1_plen_37_part_01